MLHEHLYKLDCFSFDFQSVGVSGMDSCCLLEGRPFGGCAILFHNKLLPYITPLVSCSNRFCGLKITDSCGISYLFVSVYMPNSFQNTAISDYLSTLSKLQGFITSHCCDVVLIVGDFNVDFDRRDQLCSILSERIVCVLVIYLLSALLATLMKDIIVILGLITFFALTLSL